MPGEPTPEWPSDAWLALVLGVDARAREIVGLFDDAAWKAPPIEAPPPPTPRCWTSSSASTSSPGA